MFEIPGAKRVRRSDLQEFTPPLHSPSESTLGRNEDTDDGEGGPHPNPRVSEFLQFEYDIVEKRHETRRPLDDADEVQSQAAQLEGEDHSITASGGVAENEAGVAEDEAFEFRLFSSRPPPKALVGVDQQQQSLQLTTTVLPNASNNDKTDPPTPRNHTITRIQIRSPTPPSAGSQGGGGFTVPNRPRSYYFADDDSLDWRINNKRARFEEVALQGQEVLDRAKLTSWPGTALPWRVIHLSPSSSSTRTTTTSSKPPPKPLLSSSNPPPPPEEAITPAPPPPPPPPHQEASLHRQRQRRQRQRPGKKRRIVLRKKLVLGRRAAESEQEKRTRRNREKKVKKKAREKEKQLQEKQQQREEEKERQK